MTPRPPSRATHYSASPESHGAYLAYSYTPSPTGMPNGGAPTPYHHHHHHHTPDALGLHHLPGSTVSPPPPHGGDPLGVEISDAAYQNLGLDHTPPPPMALPNSMALEQHSIPSEPTSLSLDPHSITVDHQSSVMGDPYRHPDQRGENNGPLSTFQPPPPTGGRIQQNLGPSPPPPDPSHMEGHLVWL